MCTKDKFPFHEDDNTQLQKILIRSRSLNKNINKGITEIKSKIKTTACNVKG